jgi:hypothetical protein
VGFDCGALRRGVTGRSEALDHRYSHVMLPQSRQQFGLDRLGWPGFV